MKLYRQKFLLAGVLLADAVLFTGCAQSQAAQAQNMSITQSTAVNNEPLEKLTEEAAKTDEKNIQKETKSTVGQLSEEAAEKEIPENNEASIIMVGDILLHDKVSESGLMEDGTYNYDHFFTNVKEEIEEADLALVNQEVILGGTQLGLSGYPCFNGAFEVGDSLVNAGFDVVLHATNHALDKKKDGLLNCLHFWQENYPETAVLGIHETQESTNGIYVAEVNGIRVAILNYTYGTNGIALPADMPYAVDVWNEQQIQADLVRAEQEADFTIVCPHWGTEYCLEETADQQKKAQFLSDFGADLIIGTHPHVIEPVKWIEGAGGNQTLVYYSIGNFINATSGTGKGKAARMVGAMAQVTITQEDGNVCISSYGIEPLVTHNVTGRGLITTYKLSDYTEELASVNEMRTQDSLFSLSYCQSLCEQVFGELYE